LNQKCYLCSDCGAGSLIYGPAHSRAGASNHWLKKTSFSTVGNSCRRQAYPRHEAETGFEPL
jgi:hypothetical protein